MAFLKRLPYFFAFALGVVVTDTARVALADDVDQISDEVLVCEDCTESAPLALGAMSFRHATECRDAIP